MIQVGDKIPDLKLKFFYKDGIEEVSARDLFKGKRVVLVGVPGAFTPTCHGVHLPSFIANEADFKRKGIEMVIFTAVNDIFVLKAWAEATQALGKIAFLADGNGELAKLLGLEMDVTALGMGIRSQRYDMVVDNCTVRQISVEPSSAVCGATNASAFLNEI